MFKFQLCQVFISTVMLGSMSIIGATSFGTYEGIVFFDIDGTLTTCVQADRELLVNTILSYNYAVGVITASLSYSPESICVSRPDWFPQTLCEYLISTEWIR